MKSEYKKYELIDQYLSGQLSGKELVDFEKRVLEDANWKILVSRQKLANQLLVEQRLLKAKDFIHNYQEDKPESGNSKKWIIGSLAGLLIIASFLYFYTKKENSIASANTQEEYKKPEAAIKKEENSFKKNTVPAIKPSVQKEKKNKVEVIEAEKILVIDSSEIIISVKSPFEKEKNTNINSIQEQVTQAKPIPEKKPCIENISWSVTLTPTCQDQASGILDIHDIKGGKAPYLYSIDGGKTFQQGYSFGFLESGSYAVLVKDANACSSKIITEKLSSKNCKRSKEYIFNPYRGEIWNFPVTDKNWIKLSIMNREGKIVYRLNNAGGHSDFWNGKDMSDNYSEVGLHYYIFELEDGTVMDGYITLIM